LEEFDGGRWTGVVGARKFDNYRVRTCDFKLLDKDDKILRWTYMEDWPKWQGSLFAYQKDPLDDRGVL
jgi:hypothetical protein